MKNIILIIIGIALVGLGFFLGRTSTTPQTTATNTPTQKVEEATPSLADIIQNKWISTEDPNFIRTIQKDGTIVDTYTGDPKATDSGTWEIVSDISDVLPEVPTFDGVSSYLKVVFGEETFYFAIQDATPKTLTLINLPRGNFLNFKAEE